MSKSKGNVISPIDMSDKFGTDAFRMALIVGNTPGSNVSLSENKIKGYQHFANKVWNVARFVLTNTQDYDTNNPGELLAKDQTQLTEFYEIAQEITQELEILRFDLAADKIYHYFWHTFADVILEDSKKYLNGNDLDAKKSAQHLLYEVFCQALKILHPFMPFITETIWQEMPSSNLKNTELLMLADWPIK